MRSPKKKGLPVRRESLCVFKQIKKTPAHVLWVFGCGINLVPMTHRMKPDGLLSRVDMPDNLSAQFEHTMIVARGESIVVTFH